MSSYKTNAGLLLRRCTLQCCFMLYFLCLLILVDSHHIHDSVLPFTHFILLWSVCRHYLSLYPVKFIKFWKNTASHTMVLTPSYFIIVCSLFKHFESFGFLSKSYLENFFHIQFLMLHITFFTIWCSVIVQYLFLWTSSFTSPDFWVPFSQKRLLVLLPLTIFSNTRI